MRINVYSQELTKEVSIVRKTDERGNVHFGVRMFLASHLVLHNTPADDDRSAVTFWVPNAGRVTAADLAEVFYKAGRMVSTINPVKEKA